MTNISVYFIIFFHFPLKIQQMLKDDEVFMRRMTELQTLRKKFLEQKNIYATLDDQLNRAREAQMTIQTLLNDTEERIQQQVSFFLASVIMSWTFNELHLIFLQFVEVTSLRKEIFSKNVEISIIVANNSMRDRSNTLMKTEDVQEIDSSQEESSTRKEEVRRYT